MAEEFDHDQRELAQLWKRARKDGCMPPWQQAKVFGLKEAWEEMHGDKTYGQLKWIAERVYVQGHLKTCFGSRSVFTTPPNHFATFA